MKTIPLTQGQVALVDDEDFESLNQFKWYTFKAKHTFYAARKFQRNVTIFMHRSILNAPKGMEGDHADGNGLNNQRSNLRIATPRENRRNQVRFHPNKTSKFKGVSWNSNHRKWISNIKLDEKNLYLGHFDNEIDAAKAYDLAAASHFKEFASPNFAI